MNIAINIDPIGTLEYKLNHIKKLIKIFIAKRSIHLHKSQTQKNARIQLIDQCLSFSLTDDKYLINDVPECIKNYYAEKAEHPDWSNSSNFENELNRINKEILDYKQSIIYIRNKRRKNMENAEQMIQNVRNEITHNNHMRRISDITHKQMQNKFNQLKKGGSKKDNSFINIKNVGQRKIREYKNGTKYVLIKNKKVTLDKF
jgi:ribosome-binding ATPase YchF (GTP1/OBG family)